MTFPAPNSEDRLPDILPARPSEEVLEHMRISAEAIKSLGEGALGSVPGILEDIHVNKVVEQHHMSEKKDREAKAVELYDALGAMIARLPHAVAGTRKESGDYYKNEDVRTHIFRSKSLEEIRLAESQVLWVPDATERLHVPHSMFVISRDAEDTPPFYVVGEKLIEASADQRDGVIELLLMRATADASQHQLVHVRVSSRMRDLSDRIAREKLKTPVDGASLKGRYFDQNTSEFILKAPVEGKHDMHRQIDSRRLYTYSAGDLLAEEPKWDRRVEKYWAKKEQQLLQRGLPGYYKDYYKENKLSLEDFNDYDIVHNALELALLLGSEADYSQTVGKALAQVAPDGLA